MLATTADLLRLLVVPVFVWAAVRDIRTRRLPNRLWPPLYALGALTLVLETAGRWPLVGVGGRVFLLRVAVSLLIVAPLGYALWAIGGFGGADAKAVIALALVFPTTPRYALGAFFLPLVSTPAGVFSLTVLTNALLVALAYPLWLAGSNLASGEWSVTMFLARRVSCASLHRRHGRLFEDGLTKRGVDLDALRMYLRWRGTTLAALRAAPDEWKDPRGITATYDPTDGRVDSAVTPDRDDAAGATEATPADRAAGAAVSADGGTDDPWGASQFLDAVDGRAYGADADTLREGLTAVTERDTVRVSPGMPFVVPLAIGLVLALTLGDGLYALLALVA